MSAEDEKVQDDSVREFEEAAEEKDVGLLADFWDLLRYNKKWWLTPIIIVLLLFGLLVVLAGTGLAPFIYPLF